MKISLAKFTSFAPLWLCALWIAGAPAALANDDEAQPVIDCHGKKVAFFKDGVSDDGHYAVGWTITADKGAKPVDWAAYATEGGDQFTWDYIVGDGNEHYEYSICFVDVRARQAIDLPSGRPYWWRENHGSLGVFWSPAAGGARYCLVQNETRFATENLFLVRIDKSGLSQADLAPALDKAVGTVLRENRPLYAGVMAISWPGSDWDDNSEAPDFGAGTVKIQFHADLPKSAFDMVTGHVVLDLSTGRVLKLESDAKRDDPFRDDRALAKADRELNDVYAVLQKKLAPAKFAALRKGQLAWIAKRNFDVADNFPLAGQDATPKQFAAERNKDLLQGTKERTAALKAMLPQ